MTYRPSLSWCAVVCLALLTSWSSGGCQDEVGEGAAGEGQTEQGADAGDLGVDPPEDVGAQDVAQPEPDAAADAALDVPGPEVGDPADPLELGREASAAELEQTIVDLEDFGTRYTGTAGESAARSYLVGRLEEYGLEVELDPFNLGRTETANIIAKIPGQTDPDVVWIFSAHYDSTSQNPMVTAPGADDNASGVAAVLEAARILSGQPFRHSLWLVLTAAEEQGSRGSLHMTSWMTDAGVDVRGVIAPDMIGYWPLGDDDAMDILGDTGSSHLADQMASVADALGVPYKKFIEHSYCYGDDHTNFQEAGFPAIAPMDCVEAHNLPGMGEETPHYHRESDTVDTLYLPFTKRVVEVQIATFAMWGEPL